LAMHSAAERENCETVSLFLGSMGPNCHELTRNAAPPPPSRSFANRPARSGRQASLRLAVDLRFQGK
jgi:hypothetical protein